MDVAADILHLGGGLVEKIGRALQMARLGVVLKLAQGRNNGGKAAGQAGARQLVGEMVHLRGGPFRNGSFQRGQDFPSLVEIHIHQLPHEAGITVAGGVELVKIHQ